MLVFPQLATGGSGQYPVIRRQRLRTVVNELPDGTVVRYADTDAGETRWEMRLSGLTTAEWSQIETLFTAAEGRLKTFTFLDPAANLVSWSEDLSKPVWSKDPMIQLTPAIDDLLGTTRATRAVNTAQAAQRISQTLAAPGWFHYCLSVSARGSSPGSMTLFASTASGTQSKAVALTTGWRRYEWSGNLQLTETSVEFGIELDPGAMVDLFGSQVEAQPGASLYKPTFAGGGVYAQARFQDDALAVTTRGPNQHAVTVRIVAPAQG